MNETVLDFISLNRQVHQGVEYVHANNNSKKLVIIFSGATRTFNLISGFINEKSRDYLWISEADLFGDQYFRWYSDEVYTEILSTILPRYEKQNIFLCGSSMGGYAALKYGMLFSTPNYIIRAPQIDLQIASKHFTMSRATGFIDIWKTFPSNLAKNFYIEIPNFEPDLLQFDLIKPLLDASPGLKIFNKLIEPSHVGGMWDSKRVSNVLNFFEQMYTPLQPTL